MRNSIKLLAAFAVLATIVAAPSLWALWTADGTPICTAFGVQEACQIASDGTGGAFIAWEDYRNDAIYADVYAQRVNAGGVAQWMANGTAICALSGSQWGPDVASDDAGGAIIAWIDNRPYTAGIYAQRVNASGVAQWTANGVAMCESDVFYPAIIPDGAGGAIIAWPDHRTANFDIYVQRVNASGTVLWVTNGVGLCTAAGNQDLPQLASDGAGGAIVAWQDVRSTNSDIYAQRVDSSGAVLWTANGVGICKAVGGQFSPHVVSDGAGGALITWDDYRTGTNYDIYAQRVSASGAVQWTTNGKAICTATGHQQSQGSTSDGAGGAFVTWQDNRSGTSFDIYAQRVDASGAAQWALNGVALCTEVGDQINPAIVSSDSGGVVVAWDDGRNGDYFGIFAQRVDGAGVPKWVENGWVLCAVPELPGYQLGPQITTDCHGGAIVTWRDFRSGDTPDIYAQQVDVNEGGSGPEIATLLQSYSANCSCSGIDVTWTLSEMDGGVEFAVLRAVGSPTQFDDVHSTAVIRNGLSFVFKDESVEPGTTYWYRVDVLVRGGRWNLFETGPIATSAMPLSLFQNQPNPFNPSTSVRYYMPDRGSARLDIYDATGARIATLADGVVGKGSHIVTWNGRDTNGRPVAPGVYFYRLSAGKETLTRKMVLIR